MGRHPASRAEGRARAGLGELALGAELLLELVEEAELDRLCATGAVTDAKTLIGLQWLQNWRAGRWAIPGFTLR